MFRASALWAICGRGDSPSEGETCGPEGHTAFEDEPSHAFTLMDQHVTDIFDSLMNAFKMTRMHEEQKHSSTTE